MPLLDLEAPRPAPLTRDPFLFTVVPDNKNSNDKAIVNKVCEDMGARGYPITAEDVSRQLTEAKFATEARAEIVRGPEL
jgi:hypothetical protein